MGKLGLFEYLAKPVELIPAFDLTRLTEASGDTYDDDPGVAGLGHSSSLVDGTRTTFADSDTYDDDSGLTLLSDFSGSSFADSTLETKTNGDDTYDDDQGLSPLGLPSYALDGTFVTRVENETYDDDGSLQALGFLAEL